MNSPDTQHPCLGGVEKGVPLQKGGIDFNLFHWKGILGGEKELGPGPTIRSNTFNQQKFHQIPFREHPQMTFDNF